MSTGIKFFISLLGLDYFFNSVAWYFMTHTCTYTHTHKCQTYASHVKVWIKSVKELTNLLHITHPNLLRSITIEHTHADQPISLHATLYYKVLPHAVQTHMVCTSSHTEPRVYICATLTYSPNPFC